MAVKVIERLHVGLWPARCRPQDGELLSSWMARLAAAHGLPFTRFCKRTWPGRSIWQSDLDLRADEKIISVIANKTGTDRRYVEATSLAGLKGWLIPNVGRTRYTDWVLPAMLTQLTALNRGTTESRVYVRQYCSMCLASDDLPYFRLEWRLAFVTMCARHGTELNDRCPDCGSPVVPSEADPLHHSDARQDHQALCFRCGADLRKASSSRAGVNSTDLSIQRRLNEALQIRWTEVAPGHRILSALYFPVLRQLVNFVSHGNRGAEVRSVVGKVCELDGFEPSGGPEPIFEHLPCSDRRAVLRMAIWLLGMWPTRFVETSAAFQRFPVARGQFPGTPLWFRTVLDQVARPTRHYPSKAETEWANRRTDHRILVKGASAGRSVSA